MRIFSARNPRLEKDESFIQLRGHSSHGCFVDKCLPLEKEWHVVSSYRRGSRTGFGLQSRHSDQIFAQSCNSDRFCLPIAIQKISFSSRFRGNFGVGDHHHSTPERREKCQSRGCNHRASAHGRERDKLKYTNMHDVMNQSGLTTT